MTQRNNITLQTTAAPFQEMTAAIEIARRILVVSHVNPDGDAIGTQLAFGSYLKSLGKEVILTMDSDVSPKYRFLEGASEFQKPQDVKNRDSIDLVVVLECPSIGRTGKTEKLINDDVVVMNIDHHHDNKGYGEIKWLDAGASSVGEMVFEYFYHIDHQISPSEAEALYAAIMTDTGRFRYDSTTRRTMEIAGILLSAGASSEKIAEAVYFGHPESTVKLMAEVLPSVEYHLGGRVCFLQLRDEMLARSGAAVAESDGLVDYTLYSREVQVGALLKQSGSDETRVSLRSRAGIDVSAIAAKWGGGGHARAAGCTLSCGIEDARKQLLVVLQEAIDA